MTQAQERFYIRKIKAEENGDHAYLVHYEPPGYVVFSVNAYETFAIAEAKVLEMVALGETSLDEIEIVSSLQVEAEKAAQVA